MTARHWVSDALDGSAVLRWARQCVADLDKHCDEINALNVFPVADSDTGTNLLATMRAAVAAAEQAGGPAEIAAALARGATYGARGNSGIIVSQVLRGLADTAVSGPLTAESLRTALTEAARLARAAISEPVEGTIVTVLDQAVLAVAGCPSDTPIAAIARTAADAAAVALGQTTSQLGVLRAAGVVDAGARGLVVLLDALVTVTGGTSPRRPVYAARKRSVPTAVTGPLHRYEVMFLLHKTTAGQVRQLRGQLGDLGDSVTMVDDGSGVWSVHVHCTDAGAAVEMGLEAGAVRRIRISSLEKTARTEPEGPQARAVLALAVGDGAAELFTREGAQVLRCDQPITGVELLAAIRALPQHEILVLPNGALPAQELVAVGAAARAANREVIVLPSASMVQGLAALAVHDSGRIAADDAFAMSEAAAATRWGALRIAPERALTLAGTCAAGDGLGLIGHEVVVIESDALLAGTLLLDRVLGLGGELVTMLVGADAPNGFTDKLTEHIERVHPGVEVIAYAGGQQGDLLQLGVE